MENQPGFLYSVGLLTICCGGWALFVGWALGYF